MKNKINISIICLAICVLMGINKAFGQNQSLKIGKIKNWDSFMVLSEDEKKIIESEDEWNKQQDYSYSVDSMFIQGTPDSIKEELYKMIVEKRTSFKLNRSRWDIKSYGDNIIQDSTTIDGDNISVPCCCVFEDNKIQIVMGIVLFGGTIVTIIIDEENYSANFIESAYRIKPYKYSLKDSVLVEELELKIENKSLTLIKKPKFHKDELIEGMIEFETPIYYSDYQYTIGLGGKTGKNMCEMITSGNIFFTCELKEKGYY